jgi:hypothetical protein
MTKIIRSLPAGMRSRLDNAHQSLRDTFSPSRMPRVSVRTRTWLPCWVARMIIVVIALGTASVIIHGAFGWVVVAVAALLIMVGPGAAGAALVAVVLGFSLLVSPAAPLAPRTFVLIAGTHAVLQLSALLGRTAWRAQVELAVLLAPVRRFALTQLVAQALGLVGGVLTQQRAVVAWVPVLAAGGLVLLAFWWVPRLGSRRTASRAREMAIQDAFAEAGSGPRLSKSDR